MPKEELCATCIDFSIDKVVKSMANMKPSLLLQHDYVKEFISNIKTFKKKIPKHYDTKLKLDLGSKHGNKKLLYWAANSKQSFNPVIVNAKKAYDNFENHGIVQTDENGYVVIPFRCPQLYRSKDMDSDEDKVLFRHLHFVFSNENKDGWSSQVYTKIVVCKIDYKKFKKMIDSGLFVILNACDPLEYAKDHIPNSYNLTKKSIKSMNAEELSQWLQEIVTLHYHKLNNYILQNKITIKEIPIIYYCENNKCINANQSITELMSRGYVNINQYDGGLENYRIFNPYDKT